LGDPLRIVNFPNQRDVARYWIAKSDALIFVIEQSGYVIGFRASFETAPQAPQTNVPADPSGVRLGDTLDSIKVSHPGLHASTDSDGTQMLVGRTDQPNVGAAYEFDNGRARSFQWSIRLPPDLPAIQQAVQPSGASTSDAILDAQSSEDTGVDWEYAYLAYHPCDGRTRWSIQNQSVSSTGGRDYDRLHVVCSTTKTERDFYFDITPYYGKI